jgi:F-type H+-transporting ATPase subunit b
MLEFFKEPENWVAVAFVIFIGIMLYVGAHKKIIEALDHRSARIKAELDEARRLRDEAASLLADYQRKQREAEHEAEAIVADARAEAERVAAEARTKMEEVVARCTKLAEAKIGQAEAQALADVQAAAADAAVSAAEAILRDAARGKVADDLIAQGIADVKTKLN